MLRPHGYMGRYTRRTGGRPDGLATFWKPHRFSVESMDSIQYERMGLKDNVCQLTLLRLRDSSRRKETDLPMAGGTMHNVGQNTNVPQQTNPLHAPCFLVANIHVLFNPKRGDIKLAQVRMLLETAHTATESRLHGPCPVIVCGDFNSAVGSPLYEFILRGELNLQETDRRRLSGQVEVAGRSGWGALRHEFLRALIGGARSESEALEAAINARSTSYTDSLSISAMSITESTVMECDNGGEVSSIQSGASEFSLLIKTSEATIKSDNTNDKNGKLRPWASDELRLATGKGGGEEPQTPKAQHPLNLRSAYFEVMGKEPLYTTVHDKYVGTVDYIFFTPGAGDLFEVRPVRVLSPPPLSTLRHGLPSVTWPSDHVCLVADFVIHVKHN